MTQMRDLTKAQKGRIFSFMAIALVLLYLILTFAWNEFEEGAWICPTYDDDLNIDSSRVKVFSEMVKNWKQRLL